MSKLDGAMSKIDFAIKNSKFVKLCAADLEKYWVEIQCSNGHPFKSTMTLMNDSRPMSILPSIYKSKFEDGHKISVKEFYEFIVCNKSFTQAE